jgi:signal transduction histidine kinase
MDVSLKDQLSDRSLSPILGRTVYRVVQEGLTNARKHAPGQVVTITLDGDRELGVRTEVVNRPWVGQAEADGAEGGQVESGMGLVGLTERVTLIGGKLLAEPLAGGGFRLLATLTWSDFDE